MPLTTSKPTAGWEHFRHGADIGVRGWGPTLASAFEQTALAMIAVVTDPVSVRCNDSTEVTCEAPGAELLLYDWLNALILEMATRRIIFGRFEVAINGDRLVGHAYGEPVSRERHQPAVEIKGATMTELSVAEIAPGRWRAQCVVDV
jgi:tRNA nucleotidyltransferase (CCA-adding enzyme)